MNVIELIKLSNKEHGNVEDMKMLILKYANKYNMRDLRNEFHTLELLCKELKEFVESVDNSLSVKKSGNLH